MEFFKPRTQTNQHQALSPNPSAAAAAGGGRGAGHFSDLGFGAPSSSSSNGVTFGSAMGAAATSSSSSLTMPFSLSAPTYNLASAKQQQAYLSGPQNITNPQQNHKRKGSSSEAPDEVRSPAIEPTENDQQERQAELMRNATKQFNLLCSNVRA